MADSFPGMSEKQKHKRRMSQMNRNMKITDSILGRRRRDNPQFNVNDGWDDGDSPSVLQYSPEEDETVVPAATAQNDAIRPGGKKSNPFQTALRQRINTETDDAPPAPAESTTTEPSPASPSTPAAELQGSAGEGSGQQPQQAERTYTPYNPQNPIYSQPFDDRNKEEYWGKARDFVLRAYRRQMGGDPGSEADLRAYYDRALNDLYRGADGNIDYGRLQKEIDDYNKRQEQNSEQPNVFDVENRNPKIAQPQYSSNNPAAADENFSPPLASDNGESQAEQGTAQQDGQNGNTAADVNRIPVPQAQVPTPQRRQPGTVTLPQQGATGGQNGQEQQSNNNVAGSGNGGSTDRGKQGTDKKGSDGTDTNPGTGTDERGNDPQISVELYDSPDTDSRNGNAGADVNRIPVPQAQVPTPQRRQPGTVTLPQQGATGGQNGQEQQSNNNVAGNGNGGSTDRGKQGTDKKGSDGTGTNPQTRTDERRNDPQTSVEPYDDPYPTKGKREDYIMDLLWKRAVEMNKSPEDQKRHGVLALVTDALSLLSQSYAAGQGAYVKERKWGDTAMGKLEKEVKEWDEEMQERLSKQDEKLVTLLRLEIERQKARFAQKHQTDELNWKKEVFGTEHNLNERKFLLTQDLEKLKLKRQEVNDEYDRKKIDAQIKDIEATIARDDMKLKEAIRHNKATEGIQNRSITARGNNGAAARTNWDLLAAEAYLDRDFETSPEYKQSTLPGTPSYDQYGNVTEGKRSPKSKYALVLGYRQYLERKRAEGERAPSNGKTQVEEPDRRNMEQHFANAMGTHNNMEKAIATVKNTLINLGYHPDVAQAEANTIATRYNYGQKKQQQGTQHPPGTGQQGTQTAAPRQGQLDFEVPRDILNSLHSINSQYRDAKESAEKMMEFLRSKNYSTSQAKAIIISLGM
jgi:hypothetical protein